METRSPRSSSERLPQLPGLSTIPIFKCPHCNHFASSMKALSQHNRQMRHQDGVIVTVKGLANVERCNGQKLWRKKGKMLFFATVNNDLDDVPPSRIVGSILDRLETISKEPSISMNVDRNVNPREISAFVQATRADKKLERMNISWEDAVMLSGGPRVTGCLLDSNLRDSVKGCMAQYFRMAKMHGRSDFMESKEVLSAVAAPGVLLKSKEFSFKTEETEDKYVVKCCRLLLMALRISQMKESGDKRCPELVLSSKLAVGIDRLKSLIRADTNARSEVPRKQQAFERVGHEISKRKENPRVILNAGVRKENESSERTNCLRVSKISPGEEDKVLAEGEFNDERMMSGDAQIFSGDRIDSHTEDVVANVSSNVPQLEIGSKERAVHEILRAVFYEKASLEAEAQPTFASVFAACLGVARNGRGPARMVLGIEVSPTLAALAYAAGCCGIPSISAWPEDGETDKELENIRNFHSPTGRHSINALQELAGRAKMARSCESSRAVWVECPDLNHSNCGFVGGVHLSAGDVGRTIRSMQKECYGLLLGPHGILRGCRPPNDFLKRLELFKDDEMNRDVGYSFDRHPANYDITEDCKKCIQRSLNRISLLHEEEAL